MKSFFTLLSALLLHVDIIAQNRWFTTYSDSAALQADAKQIADLFIADVTNIKKDIPFNPTVMVNTTPFLVYYSTSTNAVNLPLWDKVNLKVKDAAYKMAENEDEGKKLFGLFFNGFYLPHELAHAFQHVVRKDGLSASYANEYLANTNAMLFWRKHGKQKQLDECYNIAKAVLARLPNPVPAGKTIEDFFNENYKQATLNPAIYGFVQLGQFVKIYEDKSLSDFDTFLGNYLNKR
jgi:hypothetical protein